MLVALIILTPIIALIYSSLKPTTTELPFQVSGFSFANFVAIFSNPQILEVTANTLIYVVGSLALTLVLSLGMAYLLERTDLPGRRVLGSFVLAPMATPATVFAIAWVLVGNRVNGPVSLALQSLGINFNIYSLYGMVIVTAIFSVPSMYLMIAPQLAQLNTELEDVAASTGARWATRMRRVVLPLVAPATGAASMLMVVIAIEIFAIPAILGLPNRTFVFSSLIQEALQPAGGVPNYGKASSYGVVLLVITVVMLTFYNRLLRNSNRYQVVTGKGYRPALVRLSVWRYPLLALILGYLVIGILLPIASMVWASLMPFMQAPSVEAFRLISLDNYAKVLGMPTLIPTVINTVLVSVLTATLVVALTYWIASSVVNNRFRGARRLLDSTTLVYGVPAVVLGTAILFLYLWAPLPVYGTFWIFVIAFTTRFLPRASRMMHTALLQVGSDLSEVASVAGASRTTIAWRITVPLIRPAIIRTWLWVFAHAIGELPIALLLSTGSVSTVVVMIWQLFEQNASYPEASALSLMVLVVTLLMTLLLNSSATRQRTARR